MSERAEALTAILNQPGAESGDGAAAARVLPYVYDELRGLADAYLRGERPDHTLQATALVHEACATGRRAVVRRCHRLIPPTGRPGWARDSETK
jgi:hypothetical protein